MPKKSIKKIRYTFLFLILKIKSFKLRNAIIICCSPRGGSTWLMELFNELPHSVINFEPLQVNKGIVPKEFNFGWNPCLPKDYSNKNIEKFFIRALTLRVFNQWTTSFISIKRIINAKQVITKFILANQLLPWIVCRFGKRLKYKPVYLVRHPIPTCMSQLKNFHKNYKENWFESLSEKEKYKVPYDNFNERFKEHEIYINSLNSNLERHVALWCINNVNLLCHEDRGKWITVFYEDLIIDPKNVYINLLNAMGVKFCLKDIDNINFKKPSRTNFNNDLKSNVNEQLKSFLVKFSDIELQKFQDIFDYFNLIHYSAFNAYPIKKRDIG